MPSLTSFKFDTEGWKTHQEHPLATIWINQSIPDVMNHWISLAPPLDLPQAFPDEEALRTHFEAVTTQQDGAVVSVDLLSIQGIEAFRSILKFRVPNQPTGRIYLGTLMFPFQNFFSGIKFQCQEYGTTGMREALVIAMKPELMPIDPDKPPIVLNSIDELFERHRTTPIMRTPSDDEEYDNLIPQHPLSRCRRYLKHIAETIEFDDEIKRAKPFRWSAHKQNKGWFQRIFRANHNK